MPLFFTGSAHFRQRIVCATLSGKAIEIDLIRHLDDNPGIKDYEASFLRMIEKITNGCNIEINETGTTIKYRPGVLIGANHSEAIIHECGTTRGLGYFLEGLISLAPFCKTPMHITLTGITNCDTDISVDLLRTSTLPFLQHFGLEGFNLTVVARGAQPNGGGKVVFKCPVTKVLKPITLIDEGKLNKIRGVAYTTRVSPKFGLRMVDAARGVLNEFIPNIYIYTDHFKGTNSGHSPGYGISLIAESSTGCFVSTELCGGAGMTPEQVGHDAAIALLEEISRGGCVDTLNANVALQMMVLCQDDISKLRLGAEIPEHTLAFAKNLFEFFGVRFRAIESGEESPEVEMGSATSGSAVFTCVGGGFRNLARGIS